MKYRVLWWGGVLSEEEKSNLIHNTDICWINESIAIDPDGVNKETVQEVIRSGAGILGMAVNGTNLWWPTSDYWPLQKAMAQWAERSGGWLTTASGLNISNWVGTRCMDLTAPGLQDAWVEKIIGPLLDIRAWASWFVDQVEGEATFRQWWSRLGPIPLYYWETPEGEPMIPTAREIRSLDQAAKQYTGSMRRLLRQLGKNARRPLITNGTMDVLPIDLGRYEERVIEGNSNGNLWLPQYATATLSRLHDDWDHMPRPGDSHGMVGGGWWGAQSGPTWERFLRILHGLAASFGVGVNIRLGGVYSNVITPPWAFTDPYPDPTVGRTIMHSGNTNLVRFDGRRLMLAVNLSHDTAFMGIPPMDARWVE